MNDPIPEAFKPEKVIPTFDPCKQYCMHVHSHKHLDEIFGLLWNEEKPILVRDTFSDLVFRLIFFH